MSASVLCVHEDRSVAAIHAETLEAEGYEVLVAHDGRSTLGLLRDRSVDLVVIDAALPRQDGFEVLASLRECDAMRDVPALILFEGDLTGDSKARARSVGGEILAAPIETAALVREVARRCKPVGGAAVAMPVVPGEGSLRELPVPELMHGLLVDRYDGVMVVTHGKKKKAIEFRSGWPVAVKSNLVSECFGPFLVNAGRVSQEELDESILRMRAGQGLQGEILVAMDVLDEEALVEALRDHAVDKVLELFTWRDGHYELRRAAHVQRGSSLGLDAHPLRLVLDGVRTHFPIKQIDRYLDVHAEDFLVPSPTGEEHVADMALSDDEREWIAGFDGGARIGTLREESESLRRLVFGLVAIELLSVAGSAGDSEDVRAVATRVAAAARSVSSAEDESVRAELAEIANRIRNKDHYGVLDVPSTADDEAIRLSYASLAKRTHPDRFHAASSSVRQLAAQVFGRISEAWDGIATAEARAAYAANLAEGRQLEVLESEGKRALAAETEFQKGEAKMAARDYEGALLCFGRAMENFPSEGEYRSHYGWCLYLCHPDNEVMLQEALEHCREGLKLAKDREKPYLLLGRLYKAMGKTGAARKMFSRAVQIKPQCVEAMRELRIMNMRGEMPSGRGAGVLKKIFRR